MDAQEMLKFIEESAVRVRKVSWKKTKVIIEYQKPSPAGGFSDFKISSFDAPRPQLPVSLGKMASNVVEICELPADDEKNITVLSVKVSYHTVNEEDVRGCVITAVRTLLQSSAPMLISTPLKKECADTQKGDPRTTMTTECVSDMLNVICEAIRYVQGERQQTELPLPEKAADPFKGGPLDSDEKPRARKKRKGESADAYLDYLKENGFLVGEAPVPEGTHIDA